MKSTNNQSIAEIAAVNSLQEVSMEELDQIIGAGNGVVLTLTHECNLATWTKNLKCC
ncbi:lacticin 481 family lantibiotic [Streptococcus salivarius]|uniref:lacticin 481 family lantibiotic n=1 Tax=Streptococcus salivarius TaxID=1304 RepID=UPI00232B5782|nr:lacticin 481 family lantibiotic [Streptococcus salivarius]MDB8610611.1 lacticin 481 family lantibiotic [Streptococcus salivarius]